MTPEHSNFSEHSEHAEPSQPELITERLTLRHLREADTVSYTHLDVYKRQLPGVEV